jgi:hypothetical protein
MPFDATGELRPDYTLDNPLTEIGISPVPTSLIYKHKARMEERYSHRYAARWIEVDIPAAKLEHRLADLTCYRLPKKAAAPQAVIAIASRVKQALPQTRFVLGYFETDPYLVAILPQMTAYLGLWTSRRRLKAIARHTDDPSLRMLRWKTLLHG